MIAGPKKIGIKPQIGTITDYWLRTSAEIHVYTAWARRKGTGCLFQFTYCDIYTRLINMISCPYVYYWPITKHIPTKICAELPPTFWANHCLFYNYRYVTFIFNPLSARTEQLIHSLGTRCPCTLKQSLLSKNTYINTLSDLLSK